MLAALAFVALLLVPAIVWIAFAPTATPPVPPIVPAPAGAPSLASAAPAAAPASFPRSTPPRAPPPAAEPAEGPGDDVTGVVLDPEGRPLARAFVGCEDRDRHRAATTDDEGRFRLGADAAGCEAVARHPDHGPSERVVLRTGAGNRLRLRAQGGIEGMVVDEAGSPVPSAVVIIEAFRATDDDGVEPRRGSARVDATTGAFRIEPLPAGRYVLAASADGFPPARQTGIEVEWGRTTHHVRITLGRGTTVSGVVTDAETRRPLEGALVAVDSVGPGYTPPPARTDAAGNYRLEGAPSGLFSLRVEHAGHRTRIVTGLDARGGRSLRRDVELTPRGDGGAGNELAGIGAVLAPTPKGVVVLNVMAGGPAARDGLKKGDRIVRIDGAAAEDLPLAECVQRLRGPEGSSVRIALEREGTGLFEVVLQRENIVH